MLLPLGSLFSLLAIVLVSISLQLCSGQLRDEVVTLTSQCISEDGDFQLTCTVQNVAHLFWFFNGSNTRHYEYFRGSEDEQCPCDPTFDSMLPGVQVTVQEATGADRFDAVSVLSANLSSLSALNIHSVECGSANTCSQSVIINSDIRCAAMLSLTSQPETSGNFCPGPVIFTCVGTEVDSGVSWLVNDSSVATYEYQSTDVYPLNLNVESSLDGVTATVNIATTNPSVTNTIDVISTMSVRDVAIFNRATLGCQDASNAMSDTLRIQIGRLNSPPLPNFTSCSLLPSPGNMAEVSLQWSPSFTSQYAVERYNVSVNPDPSSCSSDQASPIEDYSCSGLVLGTRYSFTVSAINCGNQEGERDIFDTVINRPSEPADFVLSQHHNISIQWTESSYSYEGCLPVGDIEYTVELVDNTGEVVNQRVVTSDSCSNGTCSRLIPVGTCRVGVQAISPFGNSTMAELNITGVRLTTTNQALLVAGVLLLSVAIVIVIISLIMTKKGSMVSFLLLLLGCFLVVLSLVLWIVVAFQVGLQENTCDPSWQSTSDGLIIAAHMISDLALVLIVAAAVFLFITFRMKTSAHKKSHWSLKLFGPHQAGAEVNEEKEPWQKVMEERGQVRCGAGGRVEDLEAAEVIVDEFAAPGERRNKAAERVGEKLFQEYDSKVKEQEAQYDTTTHVKTPKGATPTLLSTYSQLNRSKKGEKADEGKGGGDYEHLDHKKGKSKDGDNNHKALPPTEEYGQLKTAPPPKKPPRSPAPGPMTSSKKKTERSLQGGGSTAEPASGARDKSEAQKEYKKYAKDGKMDLILDDTHLVRIAEAFDKDWDTTVAPVLGLTPDEIERIKKDYIKKPEVQKQQALQVWKKRKEQNATNGNLLRLFLTCEKRAYASALSELLS